MASKPAKKSVSISAIFKGRAGLRKDNPKLFDRSSRVSKSTTLKKHPKIFQHSLVRDFSESIDSSRAEILGDATASITSTHHTLSRRLADASAESTCFIDKALAEKDELTKPIAQEILQYGAHDGKVAGTASLGTRMRLFKKKVSKEERELDALWKEWAEVQHLLKEAGVAILGVEAVQALGIQTTGTLGVPDIAESAKTVQEIEVNKEKIGQEIESMSAGLIERMHDSEKVLNIVALTTQRVLMSFHATGNGHTFAKAAE
ncbi:hypothetical protein MMC13_003952 [Lambiella insularis]|nr:hypothetical protein [Lambiella insularis]